MNHWNKHHMLWGIDESMGVLLYWPGWRAGGL
jgi:hypothetical protein